MNVGRFNTTLALGLLRWLISQIRDAFVFDIHQFPYGARSRRKIQMNPDATRADLTGSKNLQPHSNGLKFLFRCRVLLSRFSIDNRIAFVGIQQVEKGSARDGEAIFAPSYEP